jgi:hypothetical protein
VAVGGLTGSFNSVVASVPAMLLPAAHRKLGTAAMFTPLGIGVTLGPFMAGALVDASGVQHNPYFHTQDVIKIHTHKMLINFSPFLCTLSHHPTLAIATLQH